MFGLSGLFRAKSALGWVILGFVFCRSCLWFWAISTWVGEIPPNGRFFGSDCAVAVLPSCVLSEAKVAMDKLVAFSSAVFGNTAVLSDIHSLPLIRNSYADQTAFSRSVSSTCHDKRRYNCRQLLPYPNSSFCYGFLYAPGGSAVRGNVHLCSMHYIGLLRFFL